MAKGKNTTEEKDAADIVRTPENVVETAHKKEVEATHKKVKFEVFGEEMLEKQVKLSGNSGRVYLPPDWVDHRVKVIRID